MPTEKRLFMLSATAALTEGAPAAEVYPWSETGLSFSKSSKSVFVTISGAGMLGFPRLKSKTLSAPISALRRFPYSKISRMTERCFPSSAIFLLIIAHPDSVYFSFIKLYHSFWSKSTVHILNRGCKIDKKLTLFSLTIDLFKGIMLYREKLDFLQRKCFL